MRMMITALLVLGLGGTAPPAQEGSQSRPANAASAATPTAAAQVNLNLATLIQLQTLPGIGPATAQRIMDYREQNDGFKKIEELMNVRGIGEVSFLKLRSLVALTPARAERAAVQGALRRRQYIRLLAPTKIDQPPRGGTEASILRGPPWWRPGGRGTRSSRCCLRWRSSPCFRLWRFPQRWRR